MKVLTAPELLAFLKAEGGKLFVTEFTEVAAKELAATGAVVLGEHRTKHGGKKKGVFSGFVTVRKTVTLA